MGTIHLPGNPPIDVVLRRSARARRLSLRVSRLDGRVSLTVPQRVPEQEARVFLFEKEGWLRGHLSAQAVPVLVALGASIPVEGRERVVSLGKGRGVVVSDAAIEIGGRPETVGPRLRGWLKQAARSRLTAASDTYAQRLGRSYAKVTLRDTRSRWGSCTSEGNLMYSWRLILAPRDVLDYVAAHEVAHLAEMNHSKAFWDTVERLYGPWQAQRDWLRRHGPELHRYDFGG